MNDLEIRLILEAYGKTGTTLKYFTAGTVKGNSLRDTLVELERKGYIKINRRALGFIDYFLTGSGEAYAESRV
jgi:hypothetical protein